MLSHVSHTCLTSFPLYIYTLKFFGNRKTSIWIFSGVRVLFVKFYVMVSHKLQGEGGECWSQTTNNETVKKQFSSLKIFIRCGFPCYMSSSSHVERMYTCIFSSVWFSEGGWDMCSICLFRINCEPMKTSPVVLSVTHTTLVKCCVLV